jgi:hypothetical protein
VTPGALRRSPLKPATMSRIFRRVGFRSSLTIAKLAQGAQA